MTERLVVKGFDLHCHIDLFPDPAALIAGCDKDQIVAARRDDDTSGVGTEQALGRREPLRPCCCRVAPGVGAGTARGASAARRGCGGGSFHRRGRA